MLKRLVQSANPPVPPTGGCHMSSRQNTTLSSKDSQKSSPIQSKLSLAHSGRGPSLLGLLAAKRLTRNLTNKYGRTNSTYESSRYSTSPNIQREPSYRMEPQRKFNGDTVEKVIKEVVDDRLKTMKYHAKLCANLTKLMSEEIKDRVKRLRFDRYKIIVVIHIGEKKGQYMIVSSRCAWDNKLDNFASYSMENETLFCTASVFGVYNE